MKYEKVNKPLARKMYNNGLTIILVPCKCAVDNKVARAEISMLNCDDTDPITFTLANGFESRVREFEYYNCNKDTGYYASYYVSDKDYESYEMCQMMC